ncbi:MAG: 16S rRNA (guanine(966)-N(2))-methyltransferase RsmD [Anaeromicrobium sp.]|jgi:16S rRNA (guanine(966)-N(2))-methyltransferase RsmD|uniref:16S rRNA (guanine(966)-N(2))-methyltransferase RsmD n=1 Tax=Anaeromicrobium sp. TaxID=1929132 RepID=UPI0025CE9900|nr:16S rRNA (guanine(966)-N(2))-methyltransferase RsmD [Anaeromicrobium sp.]MCT4594887.1 16S rRNA (guanine(966)-N(2))-methyltransferase RsmD [Anaeromicrobium sp.]
MRGERELRVISGRAKGRRLNSPKGTNTRPTTDRVKESVFSIINFYIRDSKVLDLFAGTGALGIEAISRGAEYGVFVDNDKNSIEVIKENLENLGFQRESSVLYCDVDAAISNLSSKGEVFHIIFMDPPYLKGFIEPSLEKIYDSNILSDDGIVLIEHDLKDILSENIAGFYKYKEKKYGNTLISIYKKEE